MLGFIANKFQGGDNLEHNFKSFYELKANDLRGHPVDFEERFKGKVVLVVNVASKWGLTDRNYKQLVELDAKYKEKGLEIVGFPCNQFLMQEPGSPEEILKFVEGYGVQFLMMEKINVNGAETHPVFRFLKTSSDREQIDWNFAKYLVDRSGVRVQHFKSGVNPKDLVGDIEKLLEQS